MPLTKCKNFCKAAGLISDEEIWLDMLASRNMTAHIYDDAQAARILTAI